VSDQVAKGIGKLKEVKNKAGSAIRKYRDKLRSRDEDPPEDP
jgi:hypothetical protein